MICTGRFFAFKCNPAFDVFVLDYSRNDPGKVIFVEPPLWSKIIIGSTTFLSYPLHFVSVPTKLAPVFHNKLWEEECEKVLKVSFWNAYSILKKKKRISVYFRVMRNRWLTVHCTPDKDPVSKVISNKAKGKKILKKKGNSLRKIPQIFIDRDLPMQQFLHF